MPEVVASVLIIEIGRSFNTPFSVELAPGTYTLRATYLDQTLPDRTTTITEGVTTHEDFTFEPPPPPEYILSITATTGGTTDPTPGNYPYPEGTVVRVTAFPDADYQFAYWTLDGVTHSQNPIDVTMDRNHTLHAVFEYVPPPPQKATIQGYVTDKDTGTPIAGATVTCNGYVDITEVDGRYEFIDVPAKVYTLKTTMSGYATEIITVDASAGGPFTQDVPLSPAAPPCFIATAAYGTQLAPQLNILRAFRDRCLPLKLVTFYYRLSPPIAHYIRRHMNVRRIVREVLSAVINILRRS